MRFQFVECMFEIRNRQSRAVRADDDDTSESARTMLLEEMAQPSAEIAVALWEEFVTVRLPLSECVGSIRWRDARPIIWS